MDVGKEPPTSAFTRNLNFSTWNGKGWEMLLACPPSHLGTISLDWELRGETTYLLGYSHRESRFLQPELEEREREEVDPGSSATDSWCSYQVSKFCLNMCFFIWCMHLGHFPETVFYSFHQLCFFLWGMSLQSSSCCCPRTETHYCQFSRILFCNIAIIPRVEH